MNLLQLRYFVAVARRKSISRAAVELHVSQPAVTRQLKLLEAELKAILMVRQHRGIELTDIGRVLLERAEFQIQSFDQMQSEFRDLSFAPSGRIRIGCPPSLTRQILAQPIEAFSSRFPNVVIEIRESISDALASAVLANQLDVAVVSTLAPQPHLKTEFLFKEPIWLFGPHGRKVRATSIKELSGIPLVMTRRNNAARDLIERHMQDRSLRLNIAIETDSSQLIAELVRRKLGYAAAPYFTFADKVKSRELSGSPIDHLVIDRSLIWRKDRPVTKAVQKFTDLLKVQIVKTASQLKL